MLKQGDHALVIDAAYYPTKILSERELKKFGIEIEYFDSTIGSHIKDLIKENTKLIFLESPASLTFEMQDIPEIVKIAKERGVATDRHVQMRIAALEIDLRALMITNHRTLAQATLGKAPGPESSILKVDISFKKN